MATERWSDDFEEDDLVGLDFPKDRPLRLHLNSSKTQSSLYSDAGDETSASGSALFSESDDNTDDAGSTRDEAPSRSQNGMTQDTEEQEEEAEEKSNTIKAGQLPAGFAEQLAASKAQAALAKAKDLADAAKATGETAGQIRHLGSVVQPPEQGFDWDEDIEGISTLKHGLRHQASFASHISIPDDPSVKVEKSVQRRPARGRQISDRDIESDFELPEAVQNVSLAGFLRKPPSDNGGLSLKHSKSSTQLSDSIASKDSTTSKSRIQPPSAHLRSTSSLSTRTDGSEFTDKHEEDDLEGLVLPDDYFGAAAGSAKGGSETSSDSKNRVDLGALLRQKVQERQVKASSSAAAHPRQSSTTSRVPHLKYKEKDDESFEEGLDVSIDLSVIASQGVRTVDKTKSKKVVGRPLSPAQASSLPSVSHGTRTLRPSRSPANLLAMASSVVNPSSTTHSGQASIRAPPLRNRPSYSNFGDHTRNAPSPQPSTSRTVARKKSSNMLSSEGFSIPTGASRSIPASGSHYSQPTRSSLARQQSVSDDGVSSAYLPFRSGGSIMQGSRSSTPISHGAIPESPYSTSTRSRFAQPTLSSQAKSRGAIRGSDPSGRSSASLGRPLSAATMSTSSLTARPMERRGAGMLSKARGDGSELDTFDDLPVNKESEKRYMKIPRQRVLSEGAARPNSPASSSTSGPLGKRVQRIRTESGSDHPSSISKRLSVHSERRTGSSSSIGGSEKATQKADSSRKAGKRPALKLIQNLSASNLTLVQGEMVFNPVSMTWEGNDSEVRMFDDIMASSSRPALISPVFGPMSPRVHAKSPLSTTSAIDSGGTSTAKKETAGFPFGTKPSLGGVRIVGDMIFDPSKMCWFNTSQEGEEEIDFGDDEADSFGEDARKSDPWKEGETMRLKTRRSFARNSASASEHEDGEEAWDEEEFARVTRAAQEAHRSQMKRFTMSKPKTQAELREHLWDILDVVNI